MDKMEKFNLHKYRAALRTLSYELIKEYKAETGNSAIVSETILFDLGVKMGVLTLKDSANLVECHLSVYVTQSDLEDFDKWKTEVKESFIKFGRLANDLNGLFKHIPLIRYHTIPNIELHNNVMGDMLLVFSRDGWEDLYMRLSNECSNKFLVLNGEGRVLVGVHEVENFLKEYYKQQ